MYIISNLNSLMFRLLKLLHINVNFAVRLQKYVFEFCGERLICKNTKIENWECSKTFLGKILRARVTRKQLNNKLWEKGPIHEGEY